MLTHTVRAITSEEQNKLNFLQQHPNVSEGIICLPDFSNDHLGLSGLVFQSETLLFPMGAGFDIGCGFAVYHIPQEAIDENIEELTKNFDLFAPSLIQPHSSITIDETDIYSIFEDPYSWAASRGIERVPSTNLPAVNPTQISRFSMPDVICSFGRIPKGNHFAEIRKIEVIEDEHAAKILDIKEGDYLLHIHSGAGYFIEQTFIQYLLSFAIESEKLAIESGKVVTESKKYPEEHGYEISLPISHELTQQYLADAARSMRISFANRLVVKHQFEQWIKKPIFPLFDNMHDKISISGTTATYQKAAQTYELVHNIPVAMLPSTMNESSFLVRQTSNFPYLNHGTGDGKGGTKASLNGILTNLSEVPNRLFFSMEECYSYAREQGWFAPICKVRPWLSIKNNQNW